MPMSSDPLGLVDCEVIGDGWLAQPVSAWSSLAFVISALITAVNLRRHPVRMTTSSWVAVGSLAAIGLGSFDYHGWQSAVAQWLHDLPIVLLLVTVVVTLGNRLRHRSHLLPGATQSRWLVLLSLLLISGIVYALGRSGSPACDPGSLWQWHALWHVTIAAALGLSIVLIWGVANSNESGDSTAVRE